MRNKTPMISVVAIMIAIALPTFVGLIVKQYTTEETPVETATTEIQPTAVPQILVTHALTINGITRERTALLDHPKPFEVLETWLPATNEVYSWQEYRDNGDGIYDDNDIVMRHIILLDDGTVAEIFTENVSTVLAVGIPLVQLLADVFLLSTVEEMLVTEESYDPWSATFTVKNEVGGHHLVSYLETGEMTILTDPNSTDIISTPAYSPAGNLAYIVAQGECCKGNSGS